MPTQSTYNNYAVYKPQTPSYTPYYDKAVVSTPTASATAKISTVTTTSTYVPTYSSTGSGGGGGGAAAAGSATVGYPSYSQSNYASSTNAYYKQMKDNKVSGDRVACELHVR